MKRLRNLFIMTVAAACFTSCADDVEDTYSSYPVYFVYAYVSTVPQLNTAMNNMGMFCTIKLRNSQFYFADESGESTQVNATSLMSYASFNMGISGFITGLPNIPELGSSVSSVVCFDLACSNCYSTYSIARDLKLQEGGYATCPTCSRTYDLNNLGIVTSGDAGSSLMRYRVTYTGNTIVINNR